MEKIVISGLNELQEAAGKLIMATPGKKIYAFYGSMGAGKTTLIKAVCEKLGSIDTVTSPTFTIVNEYFLNNGGSVYHFDFYRIEKMTEVFDIGFEEYIGSGKHCFIEWPEKIEELLPPETVKVIITEGDDHARYIEIS